MKNNIIDFPNYIAHSAQHKHSGEMQRNRGARLWLETITDTIYRLTISGCTIFCIYLAYTML